MYKKAYEKYCTELEEIEDDRKREGSLHKKEGKKARELEKQGRKLQLGRLRRSSALLMMSWLDSRAGRSSALFRDLVTLRRLNCPKYALNVDNDFAFAELQIVEEHCALQACREAIQRENECLEKERQAKAKANRKKEARERVAESRSKAILQVERKRRSEKPSAS
ncbi:hypothetical protein BU23DRAFT_630282 [Bimuria novae-zelandiae CBS 107.79]|uniref:Uncharacterized protein n=1 Tax=Bimuria novae-zelandiae CBS 107.79 TaxID=1447943 RepID=A0A6A5VHC1_9PLEO|nr:hypothetical protein BU23DRAFT_630282 [Bimuria novae-zelandiae CBS 107.79]